MEPCGRSSASKANTHTHTRAAFRSLELPRINAVNAYDFTPPNATKREEAARWYRQMTGKHWLGDNRSYANARKKFWRDYGEQTKQRERERDQNRNRSSRDYSTRVRPANDSLRRQRDARRLLSPHA